MGEPVFFERPEDLRAWFDQNADSATELTVGFHKLNTGRPSITWKQAVDEALCFGWIDSIRRSIGDGSYTNRFTPRKPRSNWSEVNIGRVEALIREGRMRPAGLAAFEARTPPRSGVYSYEQRRLAEIAPEERAAIDANPAARAFLDSRPPGYRKTVTWWIVSAKRPETRARRLAQLIEHSAARRTIPALTPSARRGARGR